MASAILWCPLAAANAERAEQERRFVPILVPMHRNAFCEPRDGMVIGLSHIRRNGRAIPAVSCDLDRGGQLEEAEIYWLLRANGDLNEMRESCIGCIIHVALMAKARPKTEPRLALISGLRTRSASDLAKQFWNVSGAPVGM